MRILTSLSSVLLTAHVVRAQVAPPLHLEPYTFRTFDGKTLPAELGKLTVAENRLDPKSRRITLAFVRLKSTAPTPGSPIVWLAGGPGVPGIVMARVPVYYALFEKLRAVADVILLDQRGIGLSEPLLECTDPHPPRDLFRSAERWRYAADKLVRTCDRNLRAKGIDVKAYTVAASADDVDDLRRALQVPKVSLIGHSYGTHLAQEMIRRHGSNVDRVVFANVEGDDQLITLPHLWDGLLQKLSYFAERDSTLPRESTHLLEMANRVVARLDAHPVALVVRNQAGDTATITVGGFGVQWLFRNYAADGRTYAKYAAFLTALDRGKYDTLATELAPYVFAFGRSQMATVTDCSIGWTRERFATAERDANAFYNIVNNQWRTNVCASLGYAGRDVNRPLLVSAVPALFLSGTLDANTPAFQAEQVRWGFPDSSHLVIENAGHETLPSSEVQDVVLDFFRGHDVSARHVTFPPPRFIKPSP